MTDRERRVAEVVRLIHESPDADGVRTFDYPLPPIFLRIRVEHDITVYYHVQERDGATEIKIVNIKDTIGTIQDMIKQYPYPWR